MNIYKTLNEITAYIDEHIEESIDYKILAKIMGVNSYTMQRIFSVITGIPLAEYIRKRRLSLATFDILTKKYKIMDLAIKYNYESSTSFSRAFAAFNGLKPSLVKSNTPLKEFPRIVFSEAAPIKNDIEYSVIAKPKLTLYGLGINASTAEINQVAPSFFKRISNKYQNTYGAIKYGMVVYNDTERCSCNAYYVLYDQPIMNFHKIIIPKSKWLKFIIKSQTATDIQAMSQCFYKKFLPSCKYNLRDIPELEYYHDDITEFLIPII